MRTLFVTIMSYPPRGGTHLRNWQNINIMQKFGEVGIFSVFNQDLHPGDDTSVKSWHHFNMVKESTTGDLIERGLRLFKRKGLRYFWAYSNRAGQELDQFLTNFKPDIVVLEELGVYPYLEVIRKHDCNIIFDNHNVESHLFKQIKCSKPTLPHWWRHQFHFPQIESAERELAQLADITWVCSPTDQNLFKEWYGSTKPSFVVPNAIHVKNYEQVRLGTFPLPAELKTGAFNILYLGNFHHPPNQEAGRLLIEEAYPQLSQVFEAFNLMLVGSNPTAFMKEAAQKASNILVTGEVPDVRPYLAAADLMVVPLLKGSGTRFKILEAFAAGLPVVSTTKGAEGLNAIDGTHLLIADQIAHMVQKIHQIRAEKDLRKKLITSGFDLLQSEYSWKAVARNIETSIRSLRESSVQPSI